MKKYVKVPAENGVPSNLPAWAKDEIVKSRLLIYELKIALLKQSARLRKITPADINDDVTEVIVTDIANQLHSLAMSK